MKQFSLEEYLKNPSMKVVTRDGIDVRIICTDRKGGGAHPVVALLPAPQKHLGEIVCTFCANGEFTMGIESGYDLFFAPEKHEGWIIINKWPDGERDTNGIIYDTELDIPNKPQVGTHRIATIKIEWEE